MLSVEALDLLFQIHPFVAFHIDSDFRSMLNKRHICFSKLHFKPEINETVFTPISEKSSSKFKASFFMLALLGVPEPQQTNTLLHKL